MRFAQRLNPPAGQITARSAGIEGQIVTVSPLIRGSVDRVLVAENELVNKGALLVELDHREIDRKIAASSAERGSRARNRYLLAQLWRVNADVLAPVGGRVIGLAARPHELVGIAQPVVTLLQSDELWIVASFERGALERIRPGQRASVHAAGTIFAARVDSIAPADGQILLEFVESAVQPGAVLRPGAPAAVTVDTRGPLAAVPMLELT
jgi:multidrug resistance efflux pump